MNFLSGLTNPFLLGMISVVKAPLPSLPSWSARNLVWRPFSQVRVDVDLSLFKQREELNPRSSVFLGSGVTDQATVSTEGSTCLTAVSLKKHLDEHL